MTQTTPVETILDRRQLRRKLTFWRLAALAVSVVALLALAARFSGESSHLTPHIARINITGVITGDRETLKLIKDVGESKASALIVEIASPGGTVTGSEKIYDELRLVAAKKPVVAVVDTMAASGGYVVAMGADRIIADANSLVGSIGVLFEFPNVSKLLDTVGVKVETIKSSPLKASPMALSRPPRRPARRSIRWWSIPTAGSSRWSSNAVSSAIRNWRRCRTDGCLPGVRGGRSSWWMILAASAKLSPGWRPSAASPRACRSRNGKSQVLSIAWAFSASPAAP